MGFRVAVALACLLTVTGCRTSVAPARAPSQTAPSSIATAPTGPGVRAAVAPTRRWTTPRPGARLQRQPRPVVPSAPRREQAPAPRREQTPAPRFAAPAAPVDRIRACPPPACVPACLSEPGAITAQGPTGMFLNPTSGIMRRGQGTVQLCLASLRTGTRGDERTTSVFGAVAAYAPTSWLEIGAILQYVDNSGEGAHVGPMIRARVVPERRLTPEFSVGLYSIEGPTAFQRRTVFAAISKRVCSPVAPSFFRGIRFHAGGRNTWRNDFDDSDLVGFGGAELALPKNIFLIGEISTKDNDSRHTPWAAGLQVRTGFGPKVSTAVIQPGGSRDLGIYVGVGWGSGFPSLYRGGLEPGH